MPLSLKISSNQTGIHESLEKIVRKHLANDFQRPFPQYSLDAFDSINNLVSKYQGPIIIDSFCGVGESTATIAAQHPEALVIGIDKSALRINKHAESYRNGATNYHLVRADVDDFWRLAVAAQWRPVKHYILYPNPWPKSSQLKRRCHGSPLFTSILALGGELEVRSNWPTYIDEFSRALSIAGQASIVEKFNPRPAITPFERKYSLSNHELWRCLCLIQAV